MWQNCHDNIIRKPTEMKKHILSCAAAALLTMRVFPVEAWLTACSPEQPARILANLNTAFRALELILMAPVLAPLVRLTERLSPCRDQKRPAVRLKEN